jgi:hypothetical protein
LPSTLLEPHGFLVANYACALAIGTPAPLHAVVAECPLEAAKLEPKIITCHGGDDLLFELRCLYQISDRAQEALDNQVPLVLHVMQANRINVSGDRNVISAMNTINAVSGRATETGGGRRWGFLYSVSPRICPERRGRKGSGAVEAVTLCDPERAC